MGRVIVCVSDLHIHPYRLQSRDGGHDRLCDGLSVLRQSLDLARSLGAVWVFAGDIKQPKTYWPQQALTGAHEVLREYKDVQKVMVAGNHDGYGIGGSGLAPFRDVATVVDDGPQVVSLSGVGSVCAPYDADPAVVAQVVERGAKVLISHRFLAGCALGPEDVRLGKGTQVAEYGPFDVAVFGDVHKGQWFHAGKWRDYTKSSEPEALIVRKASPWAGEVFYCGSPYQQSWGERNDPVKGALVLDLDSGEVRIHPIRAPRFILVETGDYEENCLNSLLTGRYAGCFVRVVWTGDECGALDDLRRAESHFRSLDVFVRKPERPRAERETDLHAGLSREEMLRRYVSLRPPPGDPEKAVAAGLRLMGGPA